MSFFEFPHTRTYDSDLGWLIKDYTTLDEFKDAMLKWIQETQPTIDEFNEIVNLIEAGDLPEGMKNAIRKWMEENAIDLVGSLVNMVIFNITDDGYFVAYIPESWDEIQFGTTGLDTFISLQPEYGHLVLSYEASTNAY